MKKCVRVIFEKTCYFKAFSSIHIGRAFQFRRRHRHQNHHRYHHHQHFRFHHHCSISFLDSAFSFKQPINAWQTQIRCNVHNQTSLHWPTFVRLFVHLHLYSTSLFLFHPFLPTSSFSSFPSSFICLVFIWFYIKFNFLNSFFPYLNPSNEGFILGVCLFSYYNLHPCIPMCFISHASHAHKLSRTHFRMQHTHT